MPEAKIQIICCVNNCKFLLEGILNIPNLEVEGGWLDLSPYAEDFIQAMKDHHAQMRLQGEGDHNSFDVVGSLDNRAIQFGKACGSAEAPFIYLKI